MLHNFAKLIERFAAKQHIYKLTPNSAALTDVTWSPYLQKIYMIHSLCLDWSQMGRSRNFVQEV